MFKYFRDLLNILKEINNNLRSIKENTKTLASCVRYQHHAYGDKYSISTKHWND